MRQMWLEFDNEQFEANRPDEDSAFCGFLNVKVANDNSGGDSERTVITFDTGGHGGSDLEVRFKEGQQQYQVNTTELEITMYGTFEAGSFFQALQNLMTVYKLKRTLGE